MPDYRVITTMFIEADDEEHARELDARGRGELESVEVEPVEWDDPAPDPDDPDYILWWGGWGGVICGWDKPECIIESNRRDALAEGHETAHWDDADWDDFHNRLIGEGIWPRTRDDAEKIENEGHLSCDICGRTVGDLPAVPRADPPTPVRRATMIAPKRTVWKSHAYDIGPEGYFGDVVWPPTGEPHLTIHFDMPGRTGQGSSAVLALSTMDLFISEQGYNEPVDAERLLRPSNITFAGVLAAMRDAIDDYVALAKKEN